MSLFDYHAHMPYGVGNKVKNCLNATFSDMKSLSFLKIKEMEKIMLCFQMKVR
jgi:hypothetical protein